MTKCPPCFPWKMGSCTNICEREKYTCFRRYNPFKCIFQFSGCNGSLWKNSSGKSGTRSICVFPTNRKDPSIIEKKLIRHWIV